MPTERPRIQVTLDSETNGLLASLAQHKDQSISSTAADLIKEALELHEDMLLSKHADERLKTTEKWISHEQAWK